MLVILRELKVNPLLLEDQVVVTNVSETNGTSAELALGEIYTIRDLL